MEAQSSAVGTSGWRDDDKELWLIKLPQGVRALAVPRLRAAQVLRAWCEHAGCSEFKRSLCVCAEQVEASDLDGKKCELGVSGAKQSSRGAVKLSDGRAFGLQPSAVGTRSQYLSSFVCNAEQRWVVGKPFAREVNVVERFEFGSEATACPKINVPVPMHVLAEQKTRGCAVLGGTSRAGGAAAPSSASGKASKPRKSSKSSKESKEKRKSKKKKKAK